MDWNPDPKIISSMKSNIGTQTVCRDAHKIKDVSLMRRVLSLLYYSEEIAFKMSNGWYVPPRMKGKNILEEELKFRQAAPVVMRHSTEFLADLLVYVNENDAGALRSLEEHLSLALDKTGLGIVPGIENCWQ